MFSYLDEEQQRRLWANMANYAATLPPSPTKRRSIRRVKTDAIGPEAIKRRYTTRVTAGVYLHLSDIAEGLSLDRSALLLHLALGNYRLRPRPNLVDGGPRTRTISMTVSRNQEKAIIRMMRACSQDDHDVIDFAIQAAIRGVNLGAPNAPVLLTTEEELFWGVVEWILEIADDCPPTPSIMTELGREYNALRSRLETYGLHPNDHRNLRHFVRIYWELVGELHVSICLPDIEMLWTRLIKFITTLIDPIKR